MPDNQPSGHPDYLSTEDIRNFMLDRSVMDNTLTMDLAFSDEVIREAMKRCAREFNATPPFVSSTTGNRLPSSNILFLYGTAKQCYLAQLQQLMRNDIDYTAGGVETNLAKKRIEHFSSLIKSLGDEFKDLSYQFKLNINIRRAYGRVG